MRSQASVRGHPLHPMLVTLPLGALPLALLFDLLAMLQGSVFGSEPVAEIAWLRAAAVATAVAAIGILLAAIPGIVDYRAVVPRKGLVFRTAQSHMVLGFLLAGVVVLSTAVHGLTASGLDDPEARQLGLWLNVLAVGMAAVQGWLGGALVYRGRVGVSEAPAGPGAPTPPPPLPPGAPSSMPSPELRAVLDAAQRGRGEPPGSKGKLRSWQVRRHEASRPR